MYRRADKRGKGSERGASPSQRLTIEEGEGFVSPLGELDFEAESVTETARHHPFFGILTVLLQGLFDGGQIARRRNRHVHVGSKLSSTGALGSMRLSAGRSGKSF